MNKAIEVVGVLVGLIVVLAFAAFAAADSSHAGDFTWRHQTVIGWLNMPVFAVGGMLMILVTGQAYQRRGTRAVRVFWFAAAGILIATGLVVALGVHPCDSLIMTWDANLPPENWAMIRERRMGWSVTFLVLSAASLTAVASAVSRDARREG